MKYDTNINKNNNSNSSRPMKYDTNLNSIKQRTSNNSKNEISTKGALIFIGIVISVIFISSMFDDDTPTHYYDDGDFNLDGKVDYDDAVKFLQDDINSQK